MIKIFNFNNVEILRIEITELCNAKCGGCPRKYLTRYNHMTETIWQKIISEENLAHIKQIYFNGNYGDFTCHPDSFSFLSQIKNKNIDIVIATNGSSRTTEYWKNLAEILCTFKNHLVIFGIDGSTQEIHSMHRVNTNLEKILKNAKEFISNNGNASWQFITFEENIHQIEEAYNLSKEYSFKEFLIMNSYTDIIVIDDKNLKALSTEKYLYFLKKYSYSYKNLQLITKGVLTACPWTKLSRIQINVDGSIWPCCWTAHNDNPLGLTYKNIPTLSNYSIKEILDSEFYQKYVTEKIYDQNSFCGKCPAKFKDIKFVYNKNKN